MTILVNIFIGVVTGGLVSYLANLAKKPSSSIKNITVYVLGVGFGCLGAQAANQLLNYGPIFLGSSIVPAAVGSIVLAFVVLYSSKKWFHL